MPFTTNAPVSVGDTATAVFTAGASDVEVFLELVGNSHVYLGDASVTTSTGLKLDWSDSRFKRFSTTVTSGDVLYGIARSGESATVRVMARSS